MKRRAGAEELTFVSLRLYRADVLKIKSLAGRAQVPYQVWIREKVHEAVAGGSGIANVVR